MKNLLESCLPELAHQIKLDSLERQRAELEIQLGQARLEGDAIKVVELEGRLFKVVSEMNPKIDIPEIEYPAPLAEAACYGLAGDIVRAVEPHTEADPVAILANLLTAFGNLIGSRTHLRVGADNHYPRLFCVLVGEPAKGRKGSSWSPIRSLFDEIDPGWVRDKIQTGLSSGEGVIWAVRDPIKKLQPVKEKGRVTDYEEVMIDEGIRDKRLFVIEEEFSRTVRVMGREGNVLSPVIRQAWDNGNLQVLTKNNPAKSTGAHISIIGHATHGELIKDLSDVEHANGFSNRFLWLCVRRSGILPFGEDFQIMKFRPLIDRLGESIELAKIAGQITWATATRSLWETVYPDLSEGRLGVIGAITARAEAQVVRLACIYALLDCSTEIEPDHLKAALAIWSYAEDSVRYIFSTSASNPLAKKIYEILLKHPQGIGRREINNALGRNYSADRIDDALDTLKASGIANSRKVQTEERPVEQWFSIQNKDELNE